MSLDTYFLRAPSAMRALMFLAAVASTSWGCARATSRGDDDRYAHGRIHVSDAKRTSWDASETEIEAAGSRIKVIKTRDSSSTVPFDGDAPAMLRALRASERHGAGDKRMLSALDTSKGRKVVVSSGVIAEVTLVKGSEYKDEKDFLSGWLPLAIVVLPPRTERDPVLYPKLKLHGDTSWVYVHERADSTWAGAIVRIVGGKVLQDPVEVSASSDNIEPIVGARFTWEDDDESIWGECGGNCCKIKGAQ